MKKIRKDFIFGNTPSSEEILPYIEKCKVGRLYSVAENSKKYNLSEAFPVYSVENYNNLCKATAVSDLNTGDIFFMVELLPEHLDVSWLKILFNGKVYAVHPNILVRCVLVPEIKTR